MIRPAPWRWDATSHGLDRPASPSGTGQQPRRLLTRRRMVALAGALAGACRTGRSAGPAPSSSAATKRERVTITFWGSAHPVIRAWWRAAVEEGVERRWPHITVDDETPAGGVEKVYAAVAAGNPPDATVLDAPVLADLASKGALAQLDGYVRSHRVDLNDLLPYHIEAARWNGNQYGLAAYGGFHHPGYNQSMGEAAGLPDPLQEDKRGAWTWERYLEFCHRLTRRQGDGVQSYGTARGTWLMWVINNGGNVLTEERTTFALDRPEALQALQFWADLVHKYRVSPPDEELRQENDAVRWRTGRLGFWFSVRGGLGTEGVNIGNEFRWNVVPVPRGRTRKTILFSNGQTVLFSASAHRDDAFLFVWGWSGREGQIARLNAGDPLTPSRRSVAGSPAFLNQTVRAPGMPDVPVPPNFNQFWAEEIRQNNLEGVPIHPRLPQILEEVNKALAPAMAGARGVLEAVAALKPPITALLRQG